MTVDVVFTVLLSSLLYLITNQDFREMRISNWLNLALLVAGLMYWLAARPEQLIAQIATAAVFGTSLWLLRETHRRATGRVGLGLGDVKLGAAGSVWINPVLLPYLLLTASVTGLAFAFAKSRATGTSLRQTRIPFGPFLCLAMLACWFLEITL